jgi:tuberous sclerosis 1
MCPSSTESVSPLSAKSTLRNKDKRYKSWPSLHSSVPSKNLIGSIKQASFDKNGIDRTTTAAKSRTTTMPGGKQKHLQPRVKTVGEHSKSLELQKCHMATQTIDACTNDQMLYSLLQEEAVLKQQMAQAQQQTAQAGQQSLNLQVPLTPGGSVMSPNAMLEQYIDLCIKKRTTEGKNSDEMHSEHIQLLNLQLQFERHRREVHAERNRRLLGKSRGLNNLESKNATLNDQVTRLNADILQLNATLNSSRRQFNAKEEEFLKEVTDWKRKYNHEVDENKRLHGTVETLQARLEEETKNRKETSLEIERLRADLLDLRNDHHQARIQADLGQQYKAELIRLQHEMVVMGEIQVKCKEKLAELHSYEARDMQMEELTMAYSEEIKGELLIY